MVKLELVEAGETDPLEGREVPKKAGLGRT